MKRLLRGMLTFIVIAAASVCLANDREMKVETHVGFKWDFHLIGNSTNVRSADRERTEWLEELRTLQKISSDIRMNALIKDHFEVNLGITGSILYTVQPMWQVKRSVVVHSRSAFGILDQATGTYHFHGVGGGGPSLTTGLFSYKYGRAEQSLGRYLFRTGVFPGYILSGDDDTYLAGALLTVPQGENIEHNLFVTPEIERNPLYDISLTYLLRAGKEKPVSVDAGVMFNRLISIKQARWLQIESGSLVDFAYKMDTTISDIGGGLKDTVYDTTLYRIGGIKPVLRVGLEIDKLVGAPESFLTGFGVFAEAAILGVRNNYDYYDNIAERIPVMVGVSLPTGGILDHLVLEAEYYGSPWRNNPGPEGIPIPNQKFAPHPTNATYQKIDNPKSSDAREQKGKTDNFKWAITARKTFLKRIELRAKVASDHYRAPSTGLGYDYEELLHAPNEWYAHFAVAIRL